MDRREIKLPSKRHNETIDSWKKMLLECDQKDHSILESLLLPGDVNKCLQLLDHPARPNLEDLVPVLCQDVSSGPSTSSPVTVLSSGDVRSILQKRRREKSHARHQVKHPHLGRSESVESKVILGEDFEVGKDSLLDGNTTGGDSRLEGQVLDLPMMGPTDLLLPVNRITGDSASIGKESCSQEQEQLEELNQVVSLLCPKLEIIQPAGCRPSDIASQMDSDKISTPNADGADSGEQDRAFSQTGLSQQQIYLWDDLRLIIELASMSSSDKVAQEV
ncbi:hypothetical protein BGW38_010239 [Lunasporangiospora selenospora]|uniref:Uncharacterized protein n=1 Tax=Lunasporangiospora selenospora TaxID=979761 RepID=A0A9P6G2S6_9FUNG|nr:hypothetical protein BGW38_010239 [Lunasporangiospora selenospora]